MLATLKSIEAASNYKIENLHFKIDELGGQYTLHIALTRNDKNTVFVFSSDPNKSLDYYRTEYGDLLKSTDSLQVANISKTKNTIGRKEHSKLSVSTGTKENSRVLRGFEQKLQSKGFVQMTQDIAQLRLDDVIRSIRQESEQRTALRDLFLYYIDLYDSICRSYNMPSLFDQEAFQHAFVSGGLIKFRYSENVKVYLEQIMGKGYAYTLLLIRGSERSMVSTPIIIELKKNQPNKDNALRLLKKLNGMLEVEIKITCVFLPVLRMLLELALILKFTNCI